MREPEGNSHNSGMDELLRSHAELRAAPILAGRHIRRLQFGRRNDDPVLRKLREVLRGARVVARKAKAARVQGVTVASRGDQYGDVGVSGGVW